MSGWRFWIDRGGTFTDVVGRSPAGALVVRKVLSVQPDCPGDPAVRAIRQVLALPPTSPLPAGLVEEVRLGTTVATNALLERRGAGVVGATQNANANGGSRELSGNANAVRAQR